MAGRVNRSSPPSSRMRKGKLGDCWVGGELTKVGCKQGNNRWKMTRTVEQRNTKQIANIAF